MQVTGASILRVACTGFPTGMWGGSRLNSDLALGVPRRVRVGPPGTGVGTLPRAVTGWAVA